MKATNESERWPFTFAFVVLGCLITIAIVFCEAI